MKFNNPIAPNIDNLSGPPVLYTSFENTTNNLSTVAEIKVWVDEYGLYNGYGVGWGDSSTNSTTDNCKNLAYNFWLTTKQKGVGGICGNFAGFFIYCLRKHNYKCGAVAYYWQENNKVVGHIEGWVVESDGRVTTTSNDYIDYKRFNSLRELKKYYDKTYSCLYYYNDHLNFMSTQEINQTF